MWDWPNMEHRSVFICFFILCCSLRCVTCSTENVTMDIDNSTYASVHHSKLDYEMLAVQKWKNAEKILHKLAVRIMREFIVQATEGEMVDISQKCMNDLGHVMRGIATMKYWAYQMLDASSHLSSGLLAGTLTDLGSYQSCLDIDVQDRFQGKFCNARISPFATPANLTIEPLDAQRFFNLINQKGGDKLLSRFLSQLHPLYSFFTFRFSVCVPSTCSGKDVENVMNRISKHVGLDWDVTVFNCNEKSEFYAPFDPVQVLALTLISIVIVTAAIGTLIEIVLNYHKDVEDCKWKSALIVKIFLCFSFVTNTKRLLKKDTNPESIKIFHGLKTFTILWVMLNHTYNLIQPQFSNSSLNIKNVVTSWSFQLVINGYPSVDTFFFITGVILVYSRMRSKSSAFSIPMYIFRRAWRLGPAVFFLTIGFFLIPRVGYGPLWKENTAPSIEACSKYWWANIFYVNNFLATENMCMVWLWYVGADMQLYIVALIVLIPIRKRPKLGLWILAICSVISIGVIIFNQLYNNLGPTVILSTLIYQADIFKSTELGYYPFYVHAIITCMGMLTGYLLYKFPKFKVPLWLNIIGWMVAFICATSTIYGVLEWNNLKQATRFESVVYAVGAKLAWSFFVAWVTMVCVTGNGGFIAKFLSLHVFVPFSRLTFSTYLVHMLVQVCFSYNSQVTLEARHRVLALMYIGFVVCSFMTAFVFSQLFESPFMNLEKLILGNALPSSKNSKSPEDTLEQNKANQVIEHNGNGTYIADISKMKIECKSEMVNSASL